MKMNQKEPKRRAYGRVQLVLTWFMGVHRVRLPVSGRISIP